METMNTDKLAISIYTEMTPNPETLKFVANKLLYPGKSVEFLSKEETTSSALANELFGFDYVKGVFIASNFVTLTKSPETDWNDVIPEMREFLKNYLQDGKEVVNEELVPKKSDNNNNQINEDDSDVVKRIKELLENYVKPAVEMDGGAISFKRFEDGKVTLLLQGSCSGCPSSTVTLKAGIEGMMKRMIPEVTEVEAEAD